MKKGVRQILLNWDKECEEDFIRGNGLHVFEQPYTTRAKENIKNMNGSHSPLFCSDWDDEEAFADRYTCQCKEMRGRLYEGERCPECKTKVKFRDIDLKVTGWIRIKKYKVIQPAYYRMLISFMSEKVINEIIGYDKDIDLDGKIKDKEPSKNPYKNIGIHEFYLNYEEILIYHKLKGRKEKQELFNILIQNKDSVFTSSIPIFSPILRPVSFKVESLFFNPIDKKYNYILSLSNLLNKKIDGDDLSMYGEKRQRMDIPTTLATLQKKLMEFYETVFVEISQKNGHIKDQILGGRINFSSRNVIIPDSNLDVDEIIVCYKMFIELFKYEIIAHICESMNYTIAQAEEIWFSSARIFNSKVYEIMEHIRQNFDIRVLINRNPTLRYGSILCMRIKAIKPTNKDYTMSLPIQVLPVLNADFDGDILNIISLKTKRLVEEYDKKYNPKNAMIISGDNALFDNDFNLLKDQSIGLYQWCNC